MRYTWHAKSWSKQAREKADALYKGFIKGNGYITVFSLKEMNFIDLSGREAVAHILENSYCAPIIRYRAAKRLGRLIRGKSKMSCKF